MYVCMCKQSTITAIYMLDFILTQVARLRKTLQTERFDLTIVSSLVDATFHTLDDSMLAAANWVLELLDEIDDLIEDTGISKSPQMIYRRKSWKTIRK